MITVVSGKVGACKSYYMTTRIVQHLNDGGVVATNMHLFPDRIEKLIGRKLLSWQIVPLAAADDPRKIPRGDFRGEGRRRVMVVLDEALNWFASKGGAKDDRKETWGEWLRQSDKLGQDVYFIAQNFERAAKWIRELAQVMFYCQNFGQFRFLRLPLGRWLNLGRLFCVSKYDVNSKQLLDWEPGMLSSSIWNCYRTAELFDFESPKSAYLGATFPRHSFSRLPLFCVVLACLVGGCNALFFK